MASRPGDTTPTVNNTPLADSTASVAGTKLTVGSIYRGTIRSRDGDGTYTVHIDAPKTELAGCLLATPVFGGLLGFNVKCRVVPGTSVELSFGNPSFIHSVIPANNEDWLNARNRSSLWGASVDKATNEQNNFSDISEDMVEGELEISNMFGVAMQFLTTLMRMSSGDKAAVECHLINDMVRIISSQYKHLSGMGDELIFDHGRPTMERGWSSYRHEVLGKLKLKDDVAEMNGDEIDKTKLESERVTLAGRHRLVEFIGFAGDFIHSFVTDPPQIAGEAAKALLRGGGGAGSGKSMIHRNSDGSVIIQSVADIRLERVCRIPVPHRSASHEDPEITKKRNYEQLEKSFLSLPKLGTIEDGDAFRAAYHIRIYSRWLSRYHAFSRMLQLDAEYDLRSESSTPPPSWTNLEDDKLAANGGLQYYDAYACITIMRDGSIVAHDGYGSSFVMSNGNIQVSASRHLDLEAAGDVRIIAGRSMYLKARRNIELNATYGGLIISSYAWLKLLCEKGSTWVRSSADTRRDKDGKYKTPKPYGPGHPQPEIGGLDENKPAALIVEAPAGNMGFRSDCQIAIMVEGGPMDEKDDWHDVRIFTKGNVTADGHAGLKLVTNKVMEVAVNQTLAIAAPTIITDARQMFVEDGTVAVVGGRFYCDSVDTSRVSAESVSTKSGKVNKQPEDWKHKPYEIKNQSALRAMKETQVLKSVHPKLIWETPSDGPKWGFSITSEYIWDARDTALGERPQTLTNQYLQHDMPDPDLWKGPGYSVWNLKRVPVGGLRMKEPIRGGFGYDEIQYKAGDDGSNLHKPTGGDPRSMPLPEMKWESDSTIRIKSLKKDDIN